MPIESLEEIRKGYSPEQAKELRILIAYWAALLTVFGIPQKKINPSFISSIKVVGWVIYYWIFHDKAITFYMGCWAQRNKLSPLVPRLLWESAEHGIIRELSSLFATPLAISRKVYFEDNISVWVLASELFEDDEVRPVYFHIPGGGMVACSPVSHFEYLKKWARQFKNRVIVSINYSKAPEAKYPTGIDECYRFLQMMMKNPKKAQDILGFQPDPSNIILGGDSAGGNFAAGITWRLVTEEQPLPKALCLIYPVLDIHPEDPENSRTRLGNDLFLPKNISCCTMDAYIGAVSEITPYLSPKEIDDRELQQFPKTLIICGERDPLVDDSREFYERAKKLNLEHKISYREPKGLTHGFLLWKLSKCQEIDFVANWIKEGD